LGAQRGAADSDDPAVRSHSVADRSWRLALGIPGALIFIDVIGAWSEAMTTLSIVFTALVLCITAGVPLGILAARSDRFFAILRPVLDTMQTIPSFVYLVPAVMLFGIGNVPGVIVTIIFAISRTSMRRMPRMVSLITADGDFTVRDGSIVAPTTPGLGVTPRLDVLGELVASYS
jgi:ABC-type proline/glycine betaine transport system permease subunit